MVVCGVRLSEVGPSDSSPADFKAIPFIASDPWNAPAYILEVQPLLH